ncbi:MAG: TIGR03643 family protein [Alphaproteobacteria bacterium]|nr:TIGR03643 family protein [Alphaproteobacteria bacterium]
MQDKKLSEYEISEIVEMALSDHTSFAQIELQYGLSDKQVKQLMRENLKPSSYKNWRTRVRKFGDRREIYK